MSTSRWIRSFALLALAAAAAVPARLLAQGITTAAISGMVTDSATGQPVEGAQIQVVNTSTGFSLAGQTRASGSYIVQGLAIGGPYIVTVRRLGFRPQSQDVTHLSLGQRQVVDFKLEVQAVTLAQVTVTTGGAVQTVINPARRGTASLVDDSTLKRSPTLNRNFTDFMSTVPQITKAGSGAASSAGGVNNRYNNIQIDGGSENDLFGLGSTGQPGGQVGAKSISLDAVKEYQVLLSPYDLRYGNFNGALVNAVTKSGTNEFTGDAYYYFRNQDMSANVPFIRTSGLYVEQYGFSVGGPIIKDRLQFFVNSEWQQRSQPLPGPYIGQASNAASPLSVDSATVQRFINDLTGLGIPTGSVGTGGAASIPNPTENSFARLDLALPEINSTFVIRDNYGTASQVIAQNPRTNPATFVLTGNLYQIDNKKNSVIAQLNTNFKNGASNELIMAYNKINDIRTPNAGIYPQIQVSVPGLQTPSTTLYGGAEQFSQGNTLSQRIFELKDNYSFFVGEEHHLTAGIAMDWWNFGNLFTQSSYGVWQFTSLANLEAGIVNRYTLSLPLTNPPAVFANPEGADYGVYLMDTWTPAPSFNMIFGLRMDVPTITNHPAYTASFDSIFGSLFQSMGRQANTSQVPSGNIQFEPRLGFNWDVTHDNRNQLRGGLGVFVGRPVYVWMGNSWQNSGSGLGFLNCGFATDPGPAPVFTVAEPGQPQKCANNAGFANGVVGPVDIMDTNLKFPSEFRANLAYDKRLPGDFFLTLEGLFSKGINDFFYVNRNINYALSYMGAHGRPMYGTIAASGATSAFIYDTTKRFSEVIDIVNYSGAFSYNFTVELQKRVYSALDMRVAYTYSHAEDAQSLTSSIALSNWRFGRSGGAQSITDEGVGISNFNQPNKLLVSGTYTFPWKRWRTDFSLIYNGYSGQPFEYVYTGSGSNRGDLNADGYPNDRIYVPSNVFDASQIQFTPIPASGNKAAIPVQAQQLALYNLIQSTPCLREHQGQILTRNSCINPWVNTLDASIIQGLPQVNGHTVTVRLDIFNLPNLLNGAWGLQKVAGGTFNNNVPLLNVVSMSGVVNAANPGAAVPIVQFSPNYVQYPTQNTVSSYYQLQFSARIDW
jgi:hypothetical protein